MLEEFAITPECFSGEVATDSTQRQALLEALRWLEANGVLANLHGGRWQHVVLETIQQLAPGAPALRDTLRRRLQSLANRELIVPHAPRGRSHKEQTPRSWLEAAEATHDAKRFHAIIHAKGRGERGPCIPLKALLENDSWSRLSSIPSVDLRQTVGDYSKGLRPLLRYARWARLIDPNLDFSEERVQNILEICIECLGADLDCKQQLEIQVHCALKLSSRNGSKRIAVVREIDLSEAEKGQAQDVLIQWERIIHDRFLQHPPMTLVLWANRRNREQWDKLHDRFVVTNQAAIGVPGGLDCNKKLGAPTSFDWKSREMRESILERFVFDRNNPSVNRRFVCAAWREIPATNHSPNV